MPGTLTLQAGSRSSPSQATLGGDDDDDDAEEVVDDDDDDDEDAMPGPATFWPARVQQLPETAALSLVAAFKCFSWGGERAGELPTLSRGCKGEPWSRFEFGLRNCELQKKVHLWVVDALGCMVPVRDGQAAKNA